MFRATRMATMTLIATVVGTASLGTAQSELDRLFEGNIPSVGKPSPSPAGGVADWTLLVYLAADNSLDEAAISDVVEMEKVGSTDRVKVAVFLDRAAGWRTARQALILPRPQAGVQSFDPTLPTCEELGEVNTGDPATLTKFLRWGAANFPARRYFLIVWNHGGGWRDLSWRPSTVRDLSGAFPVTRTTRVPAETPAFRAICWDDQAGEDCLYTSELRQALDASGLRFEILGFDACLMGMIEVAYELKHLGAVFLASEESIPADGWEYTSLLRAMNSMPQMNGPAVSQQVIAGYQRFYEAAGKSVTLSALYTGGLERLREGLDALCCQIAQAERYRETPRTVIDSARRGAGSMSGRPQYVDLGGFLTALARQNEDRAVASLAAEVGRHYEGMLFCNYAGAGVKATGLTVFFPERRTTSQYGDYTGRNLRFARDSYWDEFVRHYAGNAALSLPDPMPFTASASGVPGSTASPVTLPTGAPTSSTVGSSLPAWVFDGVGGTPVTPSTSTAPGHPGGQNALDGLFQHLDKK